MGSNSSSTKEEYSRQAPGSTMRLQYRSPNERRQKEAERQQYMRDLIKYTAQIKRENAERRAAAKEEVAARVEARRRANVNAAVQAAIKEEEALMAEETRKANQLRNNTRRQRRGQSLGNIELPAVSRGGRRVRKSTVKNQIKLPLKRGLSLES